VQDIGSQGIAGEGSWELGRGVGGPVEWRVDRGWEIEGGGGLWKKAADMATEFGGLEGGGKIGRRGVDIGREGWRSRGRFGEDVCAWKNWDVEVGIVEDRLRCWRRLVEDEIEEPTPLLSIPRIAITQLLICITKCELCYPLCDIVYAPCNYLYPMCELCYSMGDNLYPMVSYA
jgi:hypothetical protein